MEEEKQEKHSSGRKDSFTAAVVGVRGYTGAETVKILKNHPRLKKLKLFSTEVGDFLSKSIPSFRKILDDKIEVFSEDKISDCDVVFLCLEQAQAHKIVASLVEKGVTPFIIDLSPDFRFKDVRKYREIYNFDHAVPDVLSNVSYGISEIWGEEIKSSAIVANPGCYSNAFLLATYPLIGVAGDKIQDFIIDAKSGVTGAGRKPLPHLTYGYLSENIKVYAWVEHRHVPEIMEKLKEKFGMERNILFTAQLIPAKRGILETIWVKFSFDISGIRNEIFEAYEKFSQQNFFFDFCGEEFPDLYSVVGTNFIRVGIRLYKNYAMIISVIDNLIKGASGQAVQNSNVKFGFPESEGLVNLPPHFL